MSLQAHTEVAASTAPERCELPRIPDRLYFQLVRIAARYAVPMDDLLEYILRAPEDDPRRLRDLDAMKQSERAVAQAKLMREVRTAARVILCRNGGSCPEPFMYRGIVRCGCPKLHERDVRRVGS